MKKRALGIISAIVAVALLMATPVFTGCSGSSHQDESVSGNYQSTADYEMQTDGYYYTAEAPTDYVVEPVEHNTESYEYNEENRFLSVAANPLSTFSADTDTASYSNIRRFLKDGRLPDVGAVRIEEMINYFRYDYPEPTGDDPFSVTTELTACPWNDEAKLLLIGLQAEKPDTDSLPASNLVFLIDVSGSMDYSDKLPLVKQAFGLLTEQLDENDRISIVTYASRDDVVLKGATGAQQQLITDSINMLEAGGSTAGSAGITTAYAIAERYFIEGGNNRVILATDGDLNVGVTSESGLTDLIEEKRESGVFLSVMGFGTGNIKDDRMESLADHGNGSYYYIDSVAEARRVLMQEIGGTLFTVAKDVKLQVEFNPERVKGYRLIGYENRVMAAEDFNDDTKDAGEIGAGHRVTALYEIIESDSPFDIGTPELTYQTTQTTGSEDYLRLSIRYKPPQSDESTLLTYPVGEEALLDRPSDNLIFAAAVAQFGMLLRESKYAGTTTYDSILALLDSRSGLLCDEYRVELRGMVEDAKVLSRFGD